MHLKIKESIPSNYNVQPTSVETVYNGQTYCHVLGNKSTDGSRVKNLKKASIETLLSVCTLGLGFLYFNNVGRHWQKVFYSQVKVNCFVKKENVNINPDAYAEQRRLIEQDIVDMGINPKYCSLNKDVRSAAIYDKNLVVLAIKNCEQIRFVPEELKCDKDIIKADLNWHPERFSEYLLALSDEERTSERIKKEIIEFLKRSPDRGYDFSISKHVDFTEFKNDIEFIEKVILTFNDLRFIKYLEVNTDSKKLLSDLMKWANIIVVAQYIAKWDLILKDSEGVFRKVKKGTEEVSSIPRKLNNWKVQSVSTQFGPNLCETENLKEIPLAFRVIIESELSRRKAPFRSPKTD